MFKSATLDRNHHLKQARKLESQWARERSQAFQRAQAAGMKLQAQAKENARKKTRFEGVYSEIMSCIERLKMLKLGADEQRKKIERAVEEVERGERAVEEVQVLRERWKEVNMQGRMIEKDLQRLAKEKDLVEARWKRDDGEKEEFSEERGSECEPVVVKHFFKGKSAQEAAADEVELYMNNCRVKEAENQANGQKALLRGEKALVEVVLKREMVTLCTVMEKLRKADGVMKIKKGVEDDPCQNVCSLKLHQEKARKQEEMEIMFEQIVASNERNPEEATASRRRFVMKRDVVAIPTPGDYDDR